MKNKGNVKLTMIIAVICITLVVSPVTGLHADELIKSGNKTELQTTTYGQEASGMEYWALIFAVGISMIMIFSEKQIILIFCLNQKETLMMLISTPMLI